MATNVTTTKNGGCWYGLHFGCLNTHDPNCTKCAERLANAVNGVLHPPYLSNVYLAFISLRGDN
ncbi:MAG TPA: hypothetical protein VF393_05190 [archaeon]